MPNRQSPADLAATLTGVLDARLAGADADLIRRFPGDGGGRQPVHTVYVPADQAGDTVVADWGSQARGHLAAHRSLLADLVGALGVESDAILGLVDAKLAREPIEDLRIDLEDGYRGAAEDADARAAARALARAQRGGHAPPFHGIRVKSMEAPTRARGVRTLLLFLDELLGAGGTLDAFVTTVPKVTSVDQVEAVVDLLGRAEAEWALPEGSLRFEIQIETPQSVLGPDGTCLVARMIHVGAGRVTGLHYGTYDYSAACGIAAPYQSMEHPVAEMARLAMQAAAAGTGVRLSDGSTNILPVGDAAAVRRGWHTQLRLITRSLERGYYQGWDLHPSQLPSRYAATYAFYRRSAPEVTGRLHRYLHGGEGAVLDEPATARALADFVVRGMEAGALRADEIREAIKTDPADLVSLARPRKGSDLEA